MLWSSFISIYRITYITAKHRIKNEKRFLRFVILLGLVIHSVLFAIMIHFGEGSIVNKVCTGYSSSHIQILQDYKVRSYHLVYFSEPLRVKFKLE
jgi:hypothetical protein